MDEHDDLVVGAGLVVFTGLCGLMKVAGEYESSAGMAHDDEGGLFGLMQQFYFFVLQGGYESVEVEQAWVGAGDELVFHPKVVVAPGVEAV